MIAKDLIADIVNKYVEGSDLFLVDVNIRPGNIVVVEVDSKEGVGIDDCSKLSKHIESLLDREAEDFELEVGSAGITSPFKIIKQYSKNIGNEVEVLTKSGQKLSGILKLNDESHFTISISKMEKPEGAKRKVEVIEDISFAYEDVKYTKYQIRFK